MSRKHMRECRPAHNRGTSGLIYLSFSIAWWLSNCRSVWGYGQPTVVGNLQSAARNAPMRVRKIEASTASLAYKWNMTGCGKNVSSRSHKGDITNEVDGMMIPQCQLVCNKKAGRTLSQKQAWGEDKVTYHKVLNWDCEDAATQAGR